MIGVVRGIVDGFNLRAANAKPAVALGAERVEAQSLDYVDLLVPGLLAMAIAQSAAFGVAFSLVAWRQKGMLRRLRLTPLPLVEFATARILFHLLIALVQAVILLTIGRVLFGVHLVGNVVALDTADPARRRRVHRARHVHRRPGQLGGRHRRALEPDRAADDVPRRRLLPALLRPGARARDRALPPADLPRRGPPGRGRARALVHLDAAEPRRPRARRAAAQRPCAAALPLADGSSLPRPERRRDGEE